jgi:transketolase
LTENLDLRRRIVEVAYKVQAGHIASSLSCVDIIQWVYAHKKPEDRFILSKGHAALALYAVLEKQGILSKGTLDRFGEGGLPGHPDRLLCEGVEFSSGSLGHGLAFAAGLALGMRLKKEPGIVYVLMGDGECQEGSVWEAARLAARLELPVVAVVDNNLTHQGFYGSQFEILGWKQGLLTQNIGLYDLPLIVVMDTVKGKGVKRMEKDPGAWHHRQPNDQEYQEIMQELR